MRACRSVDQLRRPWRLQRRRPDPHGGPDLQRRGLDKSYGRPPVQTQTAWHLQSNDSVQDTINTSIDPDVLRAATAEMEKSGFDVKTDSGNFGPDGTPDEIELWQLHQNVEVFSNVARNAERRASVLQSFIQRQSEWLSRWAQEMRQQAYVSAKDCDSTGVLSISWRRWDEFSNGVAEQAQHALHMVRNEPSTMEDPDLDIESLLADYEVENSRLLQELGNISGEKVPLLDTVSEKPVSVGGRPCLCTRGCRCWGVGPAGSQEDRGSDPVLTIAHGWLKNDDLRLHRRIISEQRLVVERQQKLCQKQRVDLDNWSRRFSEAQEQLAQARKETEGWKVQRKRLQKMLRERMEKLADLHRDLDASSHKGKELSSALAQAQEEAEFFKLQLHPWERQKAAKKIQRRFREKQSIILEEQESAVIMLQAVTRGRLTRNRLAQGSLNGGEAENATFPLTELDAATSSGGMAGSGAAAVAAWRGTAANEEIPELDRLLDALTDIAKFQSEVVAEQDTTSAGAGTVVLHDIYERVLGEAGLPRGSDLQPAFEATGDVVDHAAPYSEPLAPRRQSRVRTISLHKDPVSSTANPRTSSLDDDWVRKLDMLQDELATVRQERDEYVAKHERMKEALRVRESEAEHRRTSLMPPRLM